ncbi:Putative Sec63 domain-containing protein [Colletotrichum destructivum]|uniref:Sec63 domain-containing protein n=1 Tax=Colletotrichum destructivum TaxID=34406 RepID=A0AAX4IXY5_9PEZI|nr:Putative Sec63 domain-containing protein [Colletotrichum destructivum]
MPSFPKPNSTPSKPASSQSQPGTQSSQTPSSTNSHKAPSAALSSHQHAIMLRYSLSPRTIRALAALPCAAPPDEILRCAASATEFLSFTFSSPEMVAFAGINNDPSTRWHLREPLTQPWHKVFLVAQCEAAGGDYGDKLSLHARNDLYACRNRIVDILGQVLRACADLMGARRDAVGLRRALETWRGVVSGSWEGMPTELLQVPGIGPKKAGLLAKHGVKFVRQLADMEFYHIERILSRNPPFGQKIVRTLAHFPRLTLAIDVAKREESTRKVIVRAMLGCSNREIPTWKDKSPSVTLAAETPNGTLVFFWRGKVGSLMSGKELVFPVEATSGDAVFVWASCEEIAGTYVTGEVKV